MIINRKMELFLAAFRHQLDAVDALLDEGADPNEPLSPEEYVYCLLRVDSPEKEGPTLDEVRKHDWYAFAVEHSASGNGAGYYPLLVTLSAPETVERLLEGGADPNRQETGTGESALLKLGHGRLYDGAAVSAGLLLKAGADVDLADAKGQTPLIYGCYRKADGGYVATLLDHGASVHARDDGGNTALHLAGFWDEGYLPWPLDNYREHGEPVPDGIDDPDEEMRYPLHSWGAREAVDALVDAGADPNSRNPDNGYTPMHWASVHHGSPYLSFLEALFERGGKPDLRNDEGLRPMDFYSYGSEKEERLKRRFNETAADAADRKTDA